ncbi:MAG: hydantoinase/oxoprolinase family protein [Deltaproteobacteria bacterium]|nr:hydantoinase/oxoprolinase family protein [Deltaproteobacteria bacterium]
MYRVSVDVGGTFTDCLVLGEEGELKQFKSPTTPQDPSLGFLACLEKAAKDFRRPLAAFLADVDLLIHGTTLATNTLINENGAKTGLITTKGFQDVIEIRRGYKNIRASMYNVFVPPYKPLVPRRHRLEVEERVLDSGEVLTPLNEDEARATAAKLKEAGMESLAVCFLHSYANPQHEQRAADIAREVFNGGYVTASHDILPVWREFERFSTTVVSAYVGPVVERYLKALVKRLEESGFKKNLLLMLSSGLVETVAHCVPRAVLLIGSGPAAAPAGAAYIGESTGRRSLISIDMGGTSLDVCLIRDGEIPTTTESWVGEERVAIKMVDIHSAGAGGGSIAWVDSLGLLRVGPHSAGAEPGPACYGRGGKEPTVTDADLLLGYVPADFFLGGEIELARDKAEEAVKKVAQPLGMTVAQAAQAIFTTVNSFMADQITEVSTKRGNDVRDFALVVGGGAGPVHGAAIAELLSIPAVLIPSVAAAYSAFGMFAMDVGRNYARSYICGAKNIDIEKVNRLYGEMEAEAVAGFRANGIAAAEIVFRRSAEMRYGGQFHEVEVELMGSTSSPQGGGFTAQQLETTVNEFHRQHEKLYTFRMPWKAAEFLTFRLRATAPRAPFHLRQIDEGGPDAAGAIKRRRRSWFDGQEVDTPVYDGARLLAGARFSGPAIIEETTTTVVIPARFDCAVDQWKNYLLTRETVL